MCGVGQFPQHSRLLALVPTWSIMRALRLHAGLLQLQGELGGEKTSTSNGQKWVVAIVSKGVLDGRYMTDAHWVRSG